jgi:hypothetical protein
VKKDSPDFAEEADHFSTSGLLIAPYRMSNATKTLSDGGQVSPSSGRRFFARGHWLQRKRFNHERTRRTKQD